MTAWAFALALVTLAVVAPLNVRATTCGSIAFNGTGLLNLNTIPPALFSADQIFNGHTSAYTWGVSLCAPQSASNVFPGIGQPCADDPTYIQQFYNSGVCESGYNNLIEYFESDGMITLLYSVTGCPSCSFAGYMLTVHLRCDPNAANLQPLGPVVATGSFPNINFVMYLGYQGLCAPPGTHNATNATSYNGSTTNAPWITTDAPWTTTPGTAPTQEGNTTRHNGSSSTTVAPWTAAPPSHWNTTEHNGTTGWVTNVTWAPWTTTPGTAPTPSGNETTSWNHTGNHSTTSVPNATAAPWSTTRGTAPSWPPTVSNTGSPGTANPVPTVSTTEGGQTTTTTTDITGSAPTPATTTSSTESFSTTAPPTTTTTSIPAPPSPTNASASTASTTAATAVTNASRVVTTATATATGSTHNATTSTPAPTRLVIPVTDNINFTLTLTTPFEDFNATTFKTLLGARYNVDVADISVDTLVWPNKTYVVFVAFSGANGTAAAHMFYDTPEAELLSVFGIASLAATPISPAPDVSPPSPVNGFSTEHVIIAAACVVVLVVVALYCGLRDKSKPLCSYCSEKVSDDAELESVRSTMNDDLRAYRRIK